MSVASFLNKTKISDIIRPKQDRGYTVIQVDENESLENAVKLLSDNGIQAVPVKSASSSQYIGFLTQLDLVTFILRKCCEEPSREEVERASEARPGQQLFEEARRGPNWDKYKDDIMKLQIAESWLPSMSDWVFVNQNENVARVVESDFSKSRQRVAVVDEKQAFVDLVTQSDLISYLAKHQHELGDLPNRPIGSLISPANASIPLVTMSMESPTVHALYMMYEHKVPCIAIVDERKRLVAGISASDLKRIRADNLTSILEPLSKFSFRNLSWLLPPVSATVSTPLSFVIQQMAAFRIHQVFVVDEESKPVAIFANSDICRILASC